MAREPRAQDAHCSIAQAAAVVGDWWSLLIIREVARGYRRFDELLGELGISRKVLTERLRHLVDHGVLTREPYQTGPVRHEYVLTDAGWALTPLLITMQDWADRWLLGDGSLTGAASPEGAEASRVHALLSTRLPSPLTLPATHLPPGLPQPSPLPATMTSLPVHAPLPKDTPMPPPPLRDPVSGGTRVENMRAENTGTVSAGAKNTGAESSGAKGTRAADWRAAGTQTAGTLTEATETAVTETTDWETADRETADTETADRETAEARTGGKVPRQLDVVADAPATVIFGYPATGVPAPLPPGWGQVPGAAGCTLENRLFRDRMPEFAAYGVAVHGVSTQRPDEQAAFAAAEGIPFPLLSDMDLRFAAALRLPTFRAGHALRLKRVILVVDRHRVVRHEIFPVLDIPRAVEESLEVARSIAEDR
ncbi:winged helix-turn-helix transcriptional regulator, partial [Nonomuraea sp. RK-328]|nr:winged helix-turn-helix transcriptional regulator [Nonomuraea sp. RK-328]